MNRKKLVIMLFSVMIVFFSITFIVANAEAEPFAYITNGSSGTVSVIDTATDTVVDTVTVGTTPHGVAVNPAGTMVYVTNDDFATSTVSVIDTASNTVVATVPVGLNPYGVSVNPAGTKVYVANYSSATVSVIDTATNTVVDTVAVGTNPFAFGQFIIPAAIAAVESQSDGKCFIATAAYGSYFEPHVKVLRDFRDNILLTNRIGEAMVSFYYRTSPPIADYIAGHENLKTATRWALTPLVYSIKHPGIAVITLIGLVMIPVVRRRRSGDINNILFL